MSNLVIPDLDDVMIERLRRRATAHGRSPAVEAKVILQEALELLPASEWEPVNAIREGLAATEHVFSDSVELVREDRDR